MSYAFEDTPFDECLQAGGRIAFEPDRAGLHGNAGWH